VPQTHHCIILDAEGVKPAKSKARGPDVAENPGGRDVLVGRQPVQVVQLDAIEEFGHDPMGQDVQILHIAGILLVAMAADAFEAVGKEDAQFGVLVGWTVLA